MERTIRKAPGLALACLVAVACATEAAAQARPAPRGAAVTARSPIPAPVTREEALQLYRAFYDLAAREAKEDRFRFGPEELNDFENLWKQSKEVADYYASIGQPGRGYTGPGYGKSWAALFAEHSEWIRKRFEPTLSAGGRGGDLDKDRDGRLDSTQTGPIENYVHGRRSEPDSRRRPGDDERPQDPPERQEPPRDGLARESFDREPGWDGVNNRNTQREPRSIVQDFGYSETANAGGGPGEVGGFITPAGEPAYYGKSIQTASLDVPLSASGRVSFGSRAGGNTLVGFFNSRTVNEWRTPNTIGFRFYGRGDEVLVELAYCTGLWRAGAIQNVRFPAAGTHEWALRYEPDGNGGGGRVVGTFDGREIVVDLDAAHKADGASLDRFGLLNVVKSADGGGELWLDDVTINGALESFDADPAWEGLRNRETYLSPEVRFRFDFGYSETNHAGGAGSGELGGLIYRGDDRSADTLAHYGAELAELSLDKPLKASGTVAFLRGHSDSGVLLGFYHSEDSLRLGNNKSGIPENFLGATIEGPSREGFHFYPVYGTDHEGEGRGDYRDSARIYPDAQPRRWTIEYSPEGNGTITVTLDGHAKTLELGGRHREIGASFNRFGIITTHVDGNAQEVYFDDLEFTAAQP